jgi:galactose mutarotase-like enzyme
VSVPLAITSGDLTARIDPFGAELVSLTDAAGHEYMTSADPRWWTGHAPVLFPIVGRLNDDTFRLDGRRYSLAKHGFARRSEFVCQEHEPYGWARFLLRDNPETRRAYPFAFELEMFFEIEGLALGVTATVRNPGDEPLPFSFGFHPAFAWPLPGGAAKEDHAIVFEHQEPEAVSRIDGEGLVARSEPTPVVGRELALRSALFEDDALIWDRLASRACTYGAPGGVSLAIAFPDTPMLGVWQKPGADFICIEPWAGIADPAGFAGDFRDTPGVMELEAGASRSFRMGVIVQRARTSG